MCLNRPLQFTAGILQICLISQAHWACQLPFQGRFFSLPPLGEVPRSGKRGVVGSFGLLPFIEQHPLSLAPLDSSPIGEPRRALPGGERPWGYALGVRWMRMVGVLVSVKSRVKVASSFSVV